MIEGARVGRADAGRRALLRRSGATPWRRWVRRLAVGAAWVVAAVILAAVVGPALAGRIGGPPESIPPSDPDTDDRAARAAMPFICFGCFVFLVLGIAGVIGLVVWKKQKK